MKPVSKFLTDNGTTYLEEAANYLQARGLTIQDTPVIPYFALNHGHYTLGPDKQVVPLVLEGWAYMVRGPDGTPKDNQYLLRVCNLPKGTIYQRQGDKNVIVEVPKFLQTNKAPILHWGCKEERFHSSPVISLHEKFSSCELMVKVLGVPSLAISGCAGWGKAGRLHPEIAELVSSLAPNCRVVVMFDGDIDTNPNIVASASNLKGYLTNLRPDLTVVFPKVPKNSAGVGWDDWATLQGTQLVDNWIKELSGEGVEIEDCIPLPYLVSSYGVSLQSKAKVPRLEQTTDNYARLLRFPRWSGLMVDFNGDLYENGQYVGTQGEVYARFYSWLERNVCLGYGSEVNDTRASKAFFQWVEERRCSVAVEILRSQPPVGAVEATEAAKLLVTKGFAVSGPMTLAENVETVLRMFRDTILRWGNDPDVDVQWVWCIIGPSGCGKSAFSKFLYEGIQQLGYRRPTKSEIGKNYPNLVEENRKARDSLVLALDDYNPSSNNARDIENMIYTLTSDRVFNQREPYARTPVEGMRRCVYFLSTTDKSRQFIRSSKGSGERRFIVMEGEGANMVDGLMRVDREVLRDCGLKLLTWAAQGAEGCGDGQALEYSEKYIGDYVQQAPGVGNLPMFRREEVERNMRLWLRSSTSDYRFSMFMLFQALSAEPAMGAKLADMVNLITECGAVRIGKARVNIGGRDVVKDTVYAVSDLTTFLDGLEAKL